MNFDFDLILVPCFLVTALCWGWYKWGLRGKQQVRFFAELFPIVLIVFVLRSFLVEPFQIPSGSMKPTLQIGDFILVSKSAYGVRLPILHQRIIPLGDPQRGDVLVFRFPHDPALRYIKRVIGIPGDQITLQNDILYLNGEQLPRSAMEHSAVETLQVLVETLGDKSYTIAQELQSPTREYQARWEVPQGHYFVMGDNRDNSNDSRFWGFVPQSHIVGRAFLVWLHWEDFFSLPSLRNARFIK